MDHVSGHGVAIAFLQFLFVLGLLWVQDLWRQRRRRAGKPDAVAVSGLLMLALLVEATLLRWQPLQRGADPFSYSLGLFDAFTVAGLVFLALQHWIRRRPAPTAA